MVRCDQADYLSIGKFARLTGLSVGALRHYDELGIITPASVERDIATLPV